MNKRNVNSMIKEIELTLSSIGSLPPDVEKAIEKLLNIVEILSHDNKSLKEEVSRLGKQLAKKKRAKTTIGDQAHVDGSQAKPNGHSSEARRKRRTPIQRKPIDRRSFKDLTIHQEVQCPIDPGTLPPEVHCRLTRFASPTNRLSYKIS